MNRFIEYSPSKKWIRIFDEDNTEYLSNPLDFELLYYGTEDECAEIANILRYAIL